MQFPATATRIKMVFPEPPFTMAGPREFSAECAPVKPHGKGGKKPAAKQQG